MIPEFKELKLQIRLKMLELRWQIELPPGKVLGIKLIESDMPDSDFVFNFYLNFYGLVEEDRKLCLEWVELVLHEAKNEMPDLWRINSIRYLIATIRVDRTGELHSGIYDLDSTVHIYRFTTDLNKKEKNEP